MVDYIRPIEFLCMSLLDKYFMLEVISMIKPDMQNHYQFKHIHLISYLIKNSHRSKGLSVIQKTNTFNMENRICRNFLYYSQSKSRSFNFFHFQIMRTKKERFARSSSEINDLPYVKLFM